jgi:tripartite-type tricarboxylate transporter receptor subunit TctC
MKTISILAAAVIGVAVVPAEAQSNYPDRPIRVIFGFPAGNDVGTRFIADKLSEALGKPIVVDNITGAAGNIAADRVAKAAPDGYTIAMLPNSNVTINTFLYKKLSMTQSETSSRSPECSGTLMC